MNSSNFDNINPEKIPLVCFSCGTFIARTEYFNATEKIQKLHPCCRKHYILAKK